MASDALAAGSYVIHVEPVPALERRLPELKDACASYLRETAGLPAAPARRLRSNWSIIKYSNARRLVSYTVAAGEPASDAEIEAELRLRVAHAVQQKQRRTAKGEDPWILALLDRYHVADLEQWSAAVRQVGSHGFRAILLVNPDGDCRILDGALWEPRI